MAKYSEELTEKIVELIAEKFYSISEVCATINISRKTFYGWMKTQSGFREEIDSALEQRDDAAMAMAMSSLRKRLGNYSLTEEKDIYAPSEDNPAKLVLKSRIIRKKEYLPDLRTIKMVLDRADRKKAAAEKLLEQKQKSMKADIEQEESKSEANENNITDAVIMAEEPVVAEIKDSDKAKKVTSQQIKNNVRVLKGSPSSLPLGRQHGEYCRKVTA
ncbi:transposase-like protein [Dysgonomonas sp. PFB1-18]|uniref:transposase n=1 Tax=unclassified Dysgonomonas TaxID=2630389 RepID=UPI002476736F|nr:MULTISPECIES: transposase [unclassified Dysgonomonas]MDH6307747.1 transposase-like protein [Dysgonomonas sp. PF1-14]MDH6337665.1 transposase-like protein [Dysgonomonas sp. PF1-16]MDH6378889.1 transposase-like protein [Dysgonomonas sp. PFB1-18]MDH6396524.1 transposase-like protein [Dysgonomonas sp. PF1-23]